MELITGKDLIAWGHKPSKQFTNLIKIANDIKANGYDDNHIRTMLEKEIPSAPIVMDIREKGELPFYETIDANDEDELNNLNKVRETMSELMRTPTIESGAIMPDACPAGPLGTIPVGGIVAARNAIHPGGHSADICCSVMITDMGYTDPKKVLDAAHSVTHFGPGGRDRDNQFRIGDDLIDSFHQNSFLNETKLLSMARSHLGTQGDGNHFLFVGKSRKTGRTAMVTHHGSRGPGALLYKSGMKIAEEFRKLLSPDTLKDNAWIPMDTEEGINYWNALQIIRNWTKKNHSVIHQATVEACGAEVGDNYWNEHNFVFKKDDDLYYHGKGATPAWDKYAPDSNGLTLIPLNMSEPVLVVKGNNADHGLGFSPHGAGRNYSRSEYKRRMGETTAEQVLENETEGLDIRFYSKEIDASELPSGYKNAKNVVDQIEKYSLAEIEDYIDPYGCIMAGHYDWKKFRKSKRNK